MFNNLKYIAYILGGIVLMFLGYKYTDAFRRAEKLKEDLDEANSKNAALKKMDEYREENKELENEIHKGATEINAKNQDELLDVAQKIDSTPDGETYKVD